MTDTSTTYTGQTPVDRARRARFVAYVVAFCLVMSSIFMGLTALGIVAQLYLQIIEFFVGSLMSLCMATTMAYIGGSVIDYNGGVASLFTGNSTSQTYSNNTTTTSYDQDSEAKG